MPVTSGGLQSRCLSDPGSGSRNRYEKFRKIGTHSRKEPGGDEDESRKPFSELGKQRRRQRDGGGTVSGARRWLTILGRAFTRPKASL